MGVKGLWKLIESAGVPVPLETLEHKVLGVDVSIWLHQAVRGFRGPGGAAVANAHLLTLFHRICKLLFYRIRPVFVFDGGVPYLKKQTLASRKLKREVATNKARQVRERLLKNLLKSQAVRNALGRSGPGPSSVHVPQVTKKEKDLFELPPLPEALAEETSVDNQEGKSGIVDSFDLPNLHHYDFESEEFKTMSLDMKHEILSELQDTRKQNSWATINDMPQQSESFADFQMARLMKRAKFQATLDSTREEIRKSKVSEMEEELFGDLEKYVSLSRRIISEDASHAIFVKKANSENDSKNVNMESDRKGKSPLKKKKPLDKDFLTELAKVGIIQHNNQLTDSDSDDESENYHPMHDKEWNDTQQESCKIEEEGFLQVVGSLMENSGLTQDEILTLIKEEQRDSLDTQCKNEISDGPSTSANAPGSIYNPDADSSDEDDDFIEVINDPQSPQEKEGKKKEDSANNIDKLLGTKTNSLWMKIVQQKVDDMVHVNTLKASPKKAIIDSRKVEKGKVPMECKTPKDGSGTLKPVKISLDFEVKPLKMEDNIFFDIFTDLVSQPESKETKELKENNLGSSQDTSTQDTLSNGINPNLNTNPQANIGHIDVNNCPEKYESLPSWSGRSEEVLRDEVELMSSGDESEDEEHSTSITCLATPTKPSHSQSPLSRTSEHKNIDIMDCMPPKVTSHEKKIDLPSSSTISKDRGKTETDSIKSIVNDSKSTHNSTSGLPKVATSTDIHLPSTQQVSMNGSRVQATKTTTLFSSKSCITDENSTGSSLPSDSSTVAGSLKKGINTKEADLKDNIDQQQNSEVTPLSTSLSGGSSPETIKNKNMNREHTSSVSEMEKETISNMTDHDDERRGITLQNVTESNVTDCTQDSTDGEDKLQTVTDVEQEREVSSSVEETEMEDNEIERPLDYTEDELKHLEGELASEQQALVAQAQQSERVAASLNDQMYGESQYLLQLFGIPYLVAPMEAEAQCAFLNTANLTEGTITDDSDIFLFGGNSVYRNFFNQTRHVEHFKMDNIKSTLGLDRSKMTTLALLSGSDYTEGIEGIGSVSGMEILTEFPGEGVECLKNLRKWWNVAHKGISTVQPSKVKQKLVQVSLPDSFPNECVYEAYMTPEVDESREKFSWAVPNVEALRNFTGDKFGWNYAKADEILLPVMKKLKIKTSQKRIESYFTNIKLIKEPKVTSKRMQEAILKAKGIKLPDSEHSSGKSQARPRQRKKKVVKNSESEPVIEESEPTSETVQDHKSSKPRRTLLVDPSEIKSKSVTEGRRGQKRKKDSKEEDGRGQKSKKDIEEPPQSDTQENKKSEGLQKKLTKEDMFKSLLEKETIYQREKEKLEKQEKKMAAAQILQKQNQEKIKKRR